MGRILYISPYYWPETIGSAPYASEVAEWLASAGHKVTVVAFRPHYPTPDAFEAWGDGARDSETHNGVAIKRVPATARGSGGFRSRLRNDFRFLLTLIKMAASPAATRYDSIVVYVPSTLALCGAALLKWRTGARLVGVIHDIESGLARALGLASARVLTVIESFERLSANRADELVVLTEGMADELRRIGVRRPISVLPIWAAAPPAEAAAPSGQSVVMYSGNFGKKQNIDQILPLIGLLGRRRPDVLVVLQGEGSERERIERSVEALGVTNTRFAPLVAADALLASLRSAHIHLVPQAINVANYALPSKLVSIMAAGRPFICIADKGSLLDRLAKTTGAGFCVYPGDEETLYARVVEILDSPELFAEMGRSGRDYVRRNMNAGDILRRYETIVSGKPGPEGSKTARVIEA